MEEQQAKHTISTTKQSRSLYGSGVEKTIAYNLSSDFVSVSEDSGIIEKIDNKNELAIIRYDSGKSDVIDLSQRQSKNSNGGFYITNQKEMLFKEGQRFKKGEILAKNPQFFVGNKSNDVSYAQGYLAKVALHCGDYTLEDSSIITEELSGNMSSLVTMMKQVKIGPNTNILSIVKKHSHIKTGQPLMTFEHSFDDADANKLLDNIDDSFAEFVEEIGHDSIISKYTGEIVDIKIYYNIDLDICSESVKKLISEYNKDIERKKKIIDKTDNVNIILPPSNKIEGTKIKGLNYEGIVIEFYIRHLDNMSIGDKVVYGTALKTIISDVIPKGEEPYSELHPDEKIEAILSPMSVISRMTTDVFCMMYTNKLIIEMKRKAKEIWDS